MEWTPRLTQLNDILSDLVPHHESIAKFVFAAGLKPQMINFNGNALDIWNNVINEARKCSKVDDLINAVLIKYPDNPFLKTALNHSDIEYLLSPKLDEISSWEKISADTLEVLTFRNDSLLPINFLEKGIIKSRSVAKVEIKKGLSDKVGTGFLFKIKGQSELFFMTNHHVISDKSDIGFARIVFDYEEDIYGNSKASKSFNIDINGPWYTSPVAELDVTIFKLIHSEEIDQYGYIQLDKVTVQRNDFVNIIQHPAGQFKKIALYHNIVTNTTDRIVQYLTDTMHGSSGSPVFNSQWEVVALHHSGGVQKTNEPIITDSKYRNEGININKIIDFLIKKVI